MDLLIMIMYLSKYNNLIINDTNNHNFNLRKKDESEGSRNS
jgi:hypothetical protein